MTSEEKYDGSALLVVGTHCTRCPAALEAMTSLLKQGELSQLRIINLEADPKAAASLGVRMVPFVSIGPFELYGLRSEKEYLQWITHARSENTGMTEYVEDMLGSGEVDKVNQHIEKDAGYLEWVVGLMGDADAKMNLRLGIGVIMEEYAASAEFEPYLDALIEYTRHEDARVRADACHYLALTENPKVVPVLEAMQSDDNAEVREVVADGLAELNTGDTDKTPAV